MTATVSVARRLQGGWGGCDPFLSVDTRLFPRPASDWRQHPFRYAAASHGCFDRPRPAGVEADNNHDTAPPLSQLPAGLDFFFLLCPRTCLAYFHKSKKKTLRLSKRVTVSAAFFCIHATISKDLYFSPPLGEKGHLGAGCSPFDF